MFYATELEYVWAEAENHYFGKNLKQDCNEIEVP